MATIIEVERKSAALRHSGSPCLRRYYTINLTAGCPCECRYCYAQSFRHNPGVGKVLFYANTLEMVRQELKRKRRKPMLVHFSTACEPFNPDPRILNMLFRIMEMLLENSIPVFALSKATIPPEFIDLFKRHRDKVFLEVGITTVNDQVRQLMEPGASSVEQRLSTLRCLTQNGIRCKAKMDPLIPGLTDGNESFSSLCQALSGEGVRSASASYLFIRGGMLKRMMVRTADWSFVEMAERLYTEEMPDYGETGILRVPPTDYKIERFRFFRDTALKYGIDLRFCHCKNPGATKDLCHEPPPLEARHAAQGKLFHE